MEHDQAGVGQEDAVLALAGGLLHDQESGRRQVRTCVSAVPNVFARRFIDVPPCGLLVPMSLAAAVAALPLVAQQLALLDGAAPLAAMFRLPLEKEELRNFLHPPNSLPSADLPKSTLQPVPPANVQSGFAAQLRGLDLDAHWRESPVWRFSGSRGEVIGSDVWVNPRAVSERLRMPALAEPANEAPAAAALAQALLRSFVNSRNVRAGQLFVEAPAELLASPETWRLLASLPGATLGRLVVVLRRSVSDNVELQSLVPQMGAIGVAVCLADFDWLRLAKGRLPDGVAWLRGKVTGGMDIMRLKESVSGAAPIRAIADIGADMAALGTAISAGFCYAAGMGVKRPCSRTTALPNQPSGPCPAGLPHPKCLQRSWACLRVLASPGVGPG